MAELKHKTTHGLKWSAIDRIATQGIQLIVMLFLGRMLGPEAFGLVGMLAIFIAISQTFVDSGFGNALIRKKDVSDTDYSTVFYFSILVAALLYAILLFAAPIIAEFYSIKELVNILRVLSVTLFFNAISVVPRTILCINLDFKTQTLASLISVTLSCMLAILLAYNNFGAWSLVYQTLSFSVLNALLLIFLCSWKPRIEFSIKSFRELFSFSSRLLLSSLINAIYGNIYQMVIGKVFTINQVGIFSQAKVLTYTPAMTLSGIIARVVYPMLSKMQGEESKLTEAYLLTLRLNCVVSFPFFLGLAVVSKPFILLVLGVEWEVVSSLMSILCLGYMLMPIHSANLNVLQVKGRSDLFLRLEIIKKLVLTLILFITVPMGVTAICIGISVQSYLALLINTYYTKEVSDIKISMQVRTILKPLFIASLCTLVGSFWLLVLDDNLSQVVIVLITSLSSYIYLIFKLDSEIFRFIKEIFNG